MTYAQKQSEVKKAIRKAKQSCRSSNTSGEKLERELRRLVERKTLVEPPDLAKSILLHKNYLQQVTNIAKDISDIVTVSTG